MWGEAAGLWGSKPRQGLPHPRRGSLHPTRPWTHLPGVGDGDTSVPKRARMPFPSMRILGARPAPQTNPKFSLGVGGRGAGGTRCSEDAPALAQTSKRYVSHIRPGQCRMSHCPGRKDANRQDWLDQATGKRSDTGRLVAPVTSSDVPARKPITPREVPSASLKNHQSELKTMWQDE